MLLGEGVVHTRLIEVTPDQESWAAWGTRLVRTNPGKTVAAVVATPIVAAATIPTAATLGTVAVASIVADLYFGGKQIKQVPVRDVAVLRDPDGEVPTVNEIYAFHPDRSRERLVIPASTFHNLIIGEQIADLVAYIRSTVRAKEIRIGVYSENGAKMAVSAPLKASDLEIQAHAGSTRHHSVELRYEDPKVIAIEGMPFWMGAFPEVVAAFRGATRGSVTRSVSVDTSFGLTASLAKAAGMDANWLGRQRFEIEASFG